MKKLLLALGSSVLLLAVTASAQSFVSQDFLTVSAILVTNDTAKEAYWTNLNSMYFGYTNKGGMEFTNEWGTYVMVTNQYAATNLAASKNVFKDAQLWADRNASPWEPGRTAYAGGTVTNLYPDGWSVLAAPSSMNISWRCLLKTNEWLATAATTTNIAVLVVGLPDGVNESTDETAQWKFAIPFHVNNCAVLRVGTATAQGLCVGYTNLPMYRFAGCQAIRVKRIEAGTAPGAGVWLTDLKLNGFRP